MQKHKVAVILDVPFEVARKVCWKAFVVFTSRCCRELGSANFQLLSTKLCYGRNYFVSKHTGGFSQFWNNPQNVSSAPFCFFFFLFFYLPPSPLPGSVHVVKKWENANKQSISGERTLMHTRTSQKNLINWWNKILTRYCYDK